MSTSLGHSFETDEMKKAFEENGFKIVNSTYPTEQHYITVAQK